LLTWKRLNECGQDRVHHVTKPDKKKGQIKMEEKNSKMDRYSYEKVDAWFALCRQLHRKDNNLM
jgi:hypothetical protein